VEEISIGEFARRARLSLKALRLYDDRGVLVPSRVDQASGYRYYDTAQLDEARLVVMMRQLRLPLAAVKELLACDPADAATRIAEHWRDAEAAHDARRDLADYLVSRLRGKRSVMYEVATREMPERSLLSLKRNVDEQGQWAFGKEFMSADGEGLALTPEDIGLRTTYLATGPSDPGIDLAVPFAVER
jgi:DNA-binding transcriptional MerR regulator